MKLYSQEAAEIEVERVFYAHVKSLSEVRKVAEKETFIWQSEIMNHQDIPLDEGGGIIRVRNYNNERYELTTKKAIKTRSGAKSAIENNIEVDAEFFKGFVSIAPISYKKTRFTIPSEDGQWDVDALWYADSDKIIPWLKIDLETSKNLTSVPNFPFGVNAWFEVLKEGNTPKQKDLLSHLFQSLCLIRNPLGLSVINTADKKPKKLDINDLSKFIS